MDESLQSRTIKLEVDSSSGQLGHKAPQEIAEGNQRATELDLYSWGARADVTSVQPGVFQGKPSCIITFEFRFTFNDNGSRSRFSEAIISTTFERLPEQGSSPTSYPIVKLVCPWAIEGPVCPMNYTSNVEKHLSVGSGGLLPVKLEAGFTTSNGVEYVKDSRIRIKGKLWNQKKGRDDQAIWTILEQSTQGEGVVDLNAAVLIQHNDQPFQGTVKILAKTKSGIRVFGWPWDAPDPLLFKPSVALGPQLNLVDFDQLSDDHWRQLCEYQGVVSVSNAICH
jgi:hypothetical protein